MTKPQFSIHARNLYRAHATRGIIAWFVYLAEQRKPWASAFTRGTPEAWR